MFSVTSCGRVEEGFLGTFSVISVAFYFFQIKELFFIQSIAKNFDYLNVYMADTR